MYTPPALPSLPPRVDLRPDCTPVEDQGQVGSCAANAAVGAFEFQLRKQGIAQVDLSRLFVYYNGRRMGGRINEDLGLTIAESMAALVAYGAPTEERWPYLPEQWATEPPKDVYNWAWQHRAKEFACVTPGEGVRGALARGFPVVFSMAVPAVCYTEAATSGMLRAPTPEEERAGLLRHAMLVVGYDLNAREYSIRNSWGVGWGDKGYCRMPFAVMDKYAHAEENWILGNLGQSAVGPQSTRPAEAAAAPQDVASLASRLREEIRAGLTKDIEDATRDIKDRFRRQ